MLRIISAIMALLCAAFCYIFMLFVKSRRLLKGLPQPPGHSFLLGHLRIAAECKTRFPPDVHAHWYFDYIRKKYSQGDIFYLDWWPIGPRWLIIADPEITSQYLTTTQSLPKSSLETEYIETFLGNNSMVAVEGNHWKQLRSIFNPGFSANHLMTLVPYIVDAASVFFDFMRQKANSNELFQLEDYATRTTMEIIGKAVMDSDILDQKTSPLIVTLFRERVALMPNTASIMQWGKYTPLRLWRLWINQRKLDRVIGQELDKKIEARLKENGSDSTTAPKSFKDRKRSIIDLALDAYQKDQDPKTRQTRKMDDTFRRNAIDSMKTFIFAGHDTTASTVAYAFYLLHLHPHVHAKVVTEINDVFGGDSTTSSIATKIKEDHHIINKLEYMTAIIKETLRLFPPASTMRYLDPSQSTNPGTVSYITDPKTNAKYPLAGWEIWPVVHMISRNETYFPNAAAFIPERFISSQTPFPDSKLLTTAAGKDAWRPFERGPRNCIGQELAMIELKIILAMGLKDFDFAPEFEVPGGKGRMEKIESWTPVDIVTELDKNPDGKSRMTTEGHRAYQILKGAAKPVDGMPGRMYIRKTS